MTYDKSLIEVWKWKEEVSESLINLTVKEKLEKIRESTRKRLASKKKLINAHLNSTAPDPAGSASLKV